MPATVAVNSLIDWQFQVFIPMDLISETEVTVEPGGMVFMGELVLKTSTKLKNSDAAQVHYLEQLAPGEAEKSAMKRAFSGSGLVLYRGIAKTITKDATAEQEFWTWSRDKVFDESEAWRDLVQKKLDAPGD